MRLRPRVSAKALWAGDQKLALRGVTYGTFRPGADRLPWPDQEVVEEDLRRMSSAGINALRTYAPPPRWLLDEAQACGICVLVGLSWEQHIAFLERHSTARSIMDRVAEGVQSCAGHPAVLGYAVGNEIPASIVRWYGRVRVERFIEQLCERAKTVDPESLVTYVNYPTTEYLQLPFLDFACFNVYLESPDALAAYVRRLHNLVGDQPLVLAELGLDSRRHGEGNQASGLGQQVDTAVMLGCAGTFVFAWTDEWHRGGYEIEDWDFGLVTRDRRAKPALEAVSHSYADPADRRGTDWPRISVVVCTYNGERWLPGCFDALQGVDYPDWEVIVVSDGSTDRTGELTRERGFRLASTSENQGLASARNLGLAAATGEIVAYLDDDARPDIDWLRHLGLAFRNRSHAAIGGPNLPPLDDGLVAQCVAAAPGGPVQMLLEDDVAEHVPGCNLAIRRDRLEAVGGFDPRYWIAGDDVDICWRLQREEHTVGFSPAAVVWHHRRATVRSYLTQQYEYGKAEGLLHKKWPERYNRLGHLSWRGRVYGRGTAEPRVGRRARINYGSWGSGLFQSIYGSNRDPLHWLPSLPECYLLLGGLLLLTLLGLEWRPLLVAVPLLTAGLAAILAAAVAGARSAMPSWRRHGRARRWAMAALTVCLYVAQPMARLAGRMRGGVTPWRRHCTPAYSLPWTRQAEIWSEHSRSPAEWLGGVETRLQATCHAVARGGECDRWDLQVRGGALGVVRILLAVEEHGAGRQLVRFRWAPRYSRAVIVLVGSSAALSVVALTQGPWGMFVALTALALSLIALAARDCGAAAGSIARAIGDLRSQPQPAGNARPALSLSPHSCGRGDHQARGDVTASAEPAQGANTPG